MYVRCVAAWGKRESKTRRRVAHYERPRYHSHKQTLKLLPPESIPPEARAKLQATPMTGSFMHLHLGIDATGLPDDLECHTTVVNEWAPIDSPQNMAILSIPTTLDPSLAPPGACVPSAACLPACPPACLRLYRPRLLTFFFSRHCMAHFAKTCTGHHVVHCYAAANEPYELWEGLKPGSPEYEALKKERAEVRRGGRDGTGRGGPAIHRMHRPAAHVYFTNARPCSSCTRPWSA